MSKRAVQAAATARATARREAEAAAALTVRPAHPRAEYGATAVQIPARSARALAGWLADDGSARGKLPTDPATWDAVARRADAAATARALLAVTTGRAYGSPVRAYRSRRGYSWPGFSPVVTPLSPDYVAATDDEGVRERPRAPRR